MYIVYILKSINYKKSYIGITEDIQRRIKQHNNGNSTFTKRWKPWVLMYSENVLTRKDARAKEKYLKSASGRR